MCVYTYCSRVKRDVLWTRAASCGLGDIPEVYQKRFRIIQRCFEYY